LICGFACLQRAQAQSSPSVAALNLPATQIAPTATERMLLYVGTYTQNKRSAKRFRPLMRRRRSAHTDLVTRKRAA